MGVRRRSAAGTAVIAVALGVILTAGCAVSTASTNRAAGSRTEVLAATQIRVPSTTTEAPATTAPPPSAVPTTVPSTTAPPVELSTLRASVLATIPFRWQQHLPGWSVVFLGPRKGYRGSTFPERRRIEVYVRSGQSFDEVVHITAHELGHAVDVTQLDGAERSRFAVARGRTADSAWWVADGADDFASGAGDWAETFAWLQTGRGPWLSRLGPPPTPAQLEVMRTLFP